MVFKFLGQLLKQSNVFGNKITRFGVNGYNSCQEVKVKLDPSVKIGQCLNILVLLQNKCVLDARWPMESCAESSFGHFSSRSVGKICTSGKFCQWSCVGFGYRLHTPIGTWYPRLPTLFGESMFSFISRIWLIYVHYSYICLCRSCEEIALKYKYSKFRRRLSLDARIGKNLGFIQADSA